MTALLLSITFSTLLLVIFKFYEKYKVNNMHAIVFNYITATTTGYLVSKEDIDLSTSFSEPWSKWALGIGLLFINVFVLIAASSQKAGIGITSVAQKMSMIIPVIAAVFLYGDVINMQIGAGIFLAIAGVILCTVSFDRSQKSSSAKWILPMVIFIGSGIADVLVKYVEHHFLEKNSHAAFSMVVFTGAASFGIILVLADVLIRKTKFEWKVIPAGIILGIPNFFSIYFLLIALSTPGWQSSVVYPLNNMSIVLATALIGIIFFREKFTVQNWIGLGLSILAIFLISIG